MRITFYLKEKSDRELREAYEHYLSNFTDNNQRPHSLSSWITSLVFQQISKSKELPGAA